MGSEFATVSACVREAMLRCNWRQCPLVSGLVSHLYGWPSFGTKWRPCLYSSHVGQHVSKESGRPEQSKVCVKNDLSVAGFCDIIWLVKI